MRYPQFRKQGFFVGSGVIESWMQNHYRQAQAIGHVLDGTRSQRDHCPPVLSAQRKIRGLLGHQTGTGFTLKSRTVLSTRQSGSLEPRFIQREMVLSETSKPSIRSSPWMGINPARFRQSQAPNVLRRLARLDVAARRRTLRMTNGAVIAQRF